MMPVLVTTAMSKSVAQGDTVTFSWLWAVQSIFINMNNSFPKLDWPGLFEDTGTTIEKRKKKKKN